jgi:hypothetical protein
MIAVDKIKQPQPAQPDPDGPQPVRFAGYVIHAIGSTIWLTSAHNVDAMSKVRH